MKTLTDVLLAGFQVKMAKVDYIIEDDRRSEAPGVIVRIQKDHMEYQVFLTEEMLKMCLEPPDELLARHVVDVAKRIEEKT